MRNILLFRKLRQGTKAIITATSQSSERVNLLPILKRDSATTPIPYQRDCLEPSHFAMEEFRMDNKTRSVHYSNRSGSRYFGRRDDKQGDAVSSTIDLTASGWAPNPLSGPSTNWAEAIEARAVTMITDSAFSTEKTLRQRTGRLSQNVQKSLRNWMTSINGTICQRKGKAMADPKTQQSVNDQSDRSLVVLTIKDNKDSFCPVAAVPDLPLEQFPTRGQHTKPFAIGTVGYSTVQFPRLPDVHFDDEVRPFASGEATANPEEPTPANQEQQMAREEDTLTQHHTHTPSNTQQTHAGLTKKLIPDDQISLLELPPPLRELYERPECQNWSLSSGFIRPAVEETNSVALAKELISVVSIPESLSLELSSSLTSDWRQVEHYDSLLGALSPPASLMIETNSLMEEPEDLGPIQNSPALSRRDSDALSTSKFTASEYSLPTIYPGMEQYPPVANCAGEINESWSNTSHSIFGSDPQYHHRVVALPVHLRGGEQPQKPRSFHAWRLFLGNLPVGHVYKDKMLIDSPMSTMENFLLGRRGKQKTGRELVEETEQRIKKGKEIHMSRTVNKAKKLTRWRFFPVSSR
ncbi:hypothetical protein OIDMADRAFT_53465 [Oidiodendron maius Zn]|uniref:Uncharacterized protein n=1 Tax=Oidiodendron maius (strain Zn) TaxID=913774 RepID=A0A0C3DIW4_OIDMZ|nr:hypothetical protein OIDMADRAFT_53465 [Oidiodendron maius Zn]